MTRSRVMAVAALSAGALVLSQGPASAAVTHAGPPTISGVDRFALFVVDDGNAAAPNPVTATFSSTADAGDKTRLNCETDSTNTPDVGGSYGTVDGPGAHTMYGNPLMFIGERCYFRAVPDTAGPWSTTDFSYGTETDWADAEIFRNTDFSGPNGGHVTDFDGILPGSAAFVDIRSAGYGGLQAIDLYDATGNASYSLFGDAGYLGSDNGRPAAARHAAIRVDGQDAYPTYTLDYQSGALSLASQVSFVRDGSTGDTTIVAVDPIQYCIGDGGTPVGTSSSGAFPTCASTRDTGVRLTRTWTVDHGGTVVAAHDVWSNASSTPHTLLAEYAQDLSSFAMPVQLPGETSPSVHSAGTDVSTSGWPASGTIVGLTDAGTPQGSAAKPAGALAYSAKPDSAHFGFDSADLQLDYQRTIAAGGTFTLTNTYAAAPSKDAAVALDAAALTAAKPTLTVSAPARTATKVVTVTGKVTGVGNGLPASVSLGAGTATATAPVAGDGTYSAKLTLSAGGNTIAAMAVDPGGIAANASAHSDYLNPVILGKPKLTKKTKTVTKVKAGKRVVTKRVTKETLAVPVSCDAIATAGCTVTLTLRVGVKTFGSVKAVIPAGGHKTVTVAVTKAGITAVNQAKVGKVLRGSVAGTYSDPAGGTLALLPTPGIRLI